MTLRARRRRLVRRVFRLVVASAFLLATSPRGASIAEGAVTSSRVDRADVVQQANASTVKIRATKVAGGKRKISNGAGVIISKDGYIVTAKHVIDGFENNIRVTTTDGDVLDAVAVDEEAAYDIAVIKVDPAGKSLAVAVFADPGAQMKGRGVKIIGNPLGMGQKIKDGVLAGTTTVNWAGHRANLQVISGQVERGNSGGGTFDAFTGELLGINVAKSELQKDTGFMVPVDRLVAIVNRKLPIAEVVDSQEIYNQIGVRLRKVKLIDGDFRDGLLVTSVRPGSAADNSGWVVGDVLVGMEKYKTADQDAVLYVLQDSQRTGDAVNFLLARGDVVEKGSMSLGSSSLAQAASQSAPADNVLVGVGH